MNFKTSDITPKQKLTIAKGLLDYEYIMTFKNDCDSLDYREVYYNFYLRARWAAMKKSENSAPYFEILKRAKPATNLIDIIEEFYNLSETKSYEFSICSKLLHTLNPNSPIYDSKVRMFLTNEMGVDLWFQTGKKANKTPLEKIKHDWDTICSWYKSFLRSDTGREWIDWFDITFPNYTCISDVKKIDCIIFATN